MILSPQTFGLTAIREFIGPVFSRLLWGFIPGEAFRRLVYWQPACLFLFA